MHNDCVLGLPRKKNDERSHVWAKSREISGAEKIIQTFGSIFGQLNGLN